AAAARATGADVAIVRVLDPVGGMLKTRAVWASSATVAAELEGTRFPAAELPREEAVDAARLPRAVRRAAEPAGARAVPQVPVALDERPLASLELLRSRERFSAQERVFARLVAYQIGLAVRAFGTGRGNESSPGNGVLEVAGEALAAGLDEARTADQVIRLAVDATGASAGLL